MSWLKTVLRCLADSKRARRERKDREVSTRVEELMAQKHALERLHRIQHRMLDLELDAFMDRTDG